MSQQRVTGLVRLWPGPVIDITENYNKRITAYCAAPALRLWLWLIAAVGQERKSQFKVGHGFHSTQIE